jgi:hypothetical protein
MAPRRALNSPSIRSSKNADTAMEKQLCSIDSTNISTEKPSFIDRIHEHGTRPRASFHFKNAPTTGRERFFG